jgi:hypothetical protein
VELIRILVVSKICVASSWYCLFMFLFLFILRLEVSAVLIGVG